ncbi:amidase [Leekyejoonella antrihumi]|uniref:Asp-tRNA(Asn)/Glu-tRNA(Gln) amidotransferase GatCAB subunit A n=1 Tax=Leekyejoonella antrihumi TaxID=1660198 RepID=A0A563DRY5_9MICO|nr:amidase [Leekyejoonella antrihumi]TWP32691.1 Asp-tRNA(Asn)/Glu-tRNA(Gln) amidotransferase GatCAB subunit A [Leekyejoonella antrihumi]
MSSDLVTKSLADLSSLIERREVSPVELTRAMLAQVDQHSDALKAYISIYHERALQSAADAEADIAKGHYRGRLHGIPMGIKDNMSFAGQVTTMGSKIHRDFVSDHDATVVERLRRTGAVFLGKLNLHEYALGVTTDNPWYGTCRNPWDLDKTPGGSSGGSAAAVASHLSVVSLGSDTSGSIRIPAAMCGVVGLKPTYGRVSKFGVFPEAWTLDHVGPITQTVTDAAILLDAISGYDVHDPASLDLPPTRTAEALSSAVSGLVIGVDDEYFYADVDDDVAARSRAVIAGLEELGAIVRPVTIGDSQHYEYALTVIDTAESTAVHHANLRDRPQDFGDDVRLLLECGELPSAVDYLKAQQVRYRLRDQMRAVFNQVDVLIAPTVPVRCPAVGESITTLNGRQVETGDALMRLIGPASLLGLPSLSLPAGVIDGMPVGLQIIGPPLGEQRVLDTGLACVFHGLRCDARSGDVKVPVL